MTPLDWIIIGVFVAVLLVAYAIAAYQNQKIEGEIEFLELLIKKLESQREKEEK